MTGACCTTSNANITKPTNQLKTLCTLFCDSYHLRNIIVLCHDQPRSFWSIYNYGGAYITICKQSRFVGRHCIERSIALALQQQAKAGIAFSCLGSVSEKVTQQEQVLIAVVVKIVSQYALRRGELRLHGQGTFREFQLFLLHKDNALNFRAPEHLRFRALLGIKNVVEGGTCIISIFDVLLLQHRNLIQ